MFISRISRHPFGAYAALLLLQILSTHHRCSARQITNDCAPSSCGNFRNISSPFRLNTDPRSCGDRFIELGCEDNVRLTFNWNMVKYYVEAISYSDSTIQLVDAAVQKDDCFSIPHHSLTHRELSSLNFYYNNYHYHFYYKRLERSVLAFICCENQIPNPLPDYIMDTSSCKNGSATAHNSSPSCVNMEGHSYVMVDGDFKDVPDLCLVNLMYIIAPKNVTNMSYTDVHDILADGFELQWYNYEDPSSKSLLGLLSFFEGIDWIAWRTGMAGDSYNLFHEGITWILCRTSGYEYNCGFYRFTTPQVLLSFLMLFLLALLAFIVIYHVLLFPCGLPCLLTLLIYKWRRRHLSMYDNIEKFLQSHDNDLVPIRYTYSEIKKITNGFKDKLGQGGFGSVYKGKLRSGRFAAVKLLGSSKANGQDFINKVDTIGRIHHVNVVQLIGFSVEGSKRALIYEFMPNGSLERYIFSRQGNVPQEDATEHEKKTTTKMVIVALWCIQLKPVDRPSMHKVVEMLESDVESLRMPPKPFLTPHEVQEDDYRANNTKLSDPPNDMDSSYQFGR